MPGFLPATAPTGPARGKPKKAGHFPAYKPAEPSVTSATRRIVFHLLYPWQVT